MATAWTQDAENASSWSQDAKNTSTYVSYIKRGNEPLVGALSETLMDIGEYTFDDVIDVEGKMLSDVTLEGGDLGEQAYTYPTKN